MAAKRIVVVVFLCAISFAVGIIVSAYHQAHSYDNTSPHAGNGDRHVDKPSKLIGPKRGSGVPAKVEGFSGHPDMMYVPVDLLAKYWPSPLIDYNSGKFEFSALFTYGLDIERTKALQMKLNNAVEEVSKLEVKHSKLVTDPNGDQYFEITPFPSEGQQIKEKIDTIVSDAFKEIPDDRGKLLALAITNHPVFSGFGNNSMQIAIEEGRSTDGSVQHVLRMKSNLHSGRIIDSASFTMSENYIANRFRSLVEHHLPGSQ